MPPTLGSRDLRTLLELQGELGEIACDSPDGAIDHLLAALPVLLGGDPAVWWNVTDGTGKKLLASRVAGLDEGSKRRWERGYELEGVYAENPLWPHLMSGPFRTLRREEVISDRSWYGNPHIAEFCNGLGYDDCVASRSAVAPRMATDEPMQAMVAICRPLGERRFSSRDAELIQVVQQRLGWLHRRAALSATAQQRQRTAASLPPRFRRLLDQLLRGRSEKEIADALGLSNRTVHKYVEHLYERFSVHSRAELMALWIESPRAEPADNARS